MWFTLLKRILKNPKKHRNIPQKYIKDGTGSGVNQNPLKIITVILIILLVFDTGFVFEIANDPYSASISLSRNRIDNCAPETAAWFYTILTPEGEAFSARWLSEHRRSPSSIYATYLDVRVHALSLYGMILPSEVSQMFNDTKNVNKNTYIYLTYLNVVKGWGTHKTYQGETIWNISEISPLLTNSMKIYANGDNEIYWSC